MANTHKSLADVEVVAEQFDLTSNPQLIPACCVADGDWNRATGIMEGYKVSTDAMVCFVSSGDWIVTYDGTHTVVMSDAMFTAMFTEIA